MGLFSVCGYKGKRFFSNSVRRVRYGIDMPLNEFKGRDSCSLICLMKRWEREAAMRSRGGAGGRETAMRSRGGARRNCGTAVRVQKAK